jgi:hypothetical protein
MGGSSLMMVTPRVSEVSKLFNSSYDTYESPRIDNYLVTLDLTSSFETSEGKNYKMTKINTEVPKIKDMALWSNAANTTLYQYGGRFLENITSENTIWTYATKKKSWNKQDGTIQPSRLEYGGELEVNSLARFRSNTRSLTSLYKCACYPRRLLDRWLSG